MRKYLLFAALLLGLVVQGAPAVSAQEPAAPAVEAETAPGDAATLSGYPCPQLSGVSGQDSQIIETYWWIQNGCPIPIRKGFSGSTGFGWDHIVWWNNQGQQNHQVTQYARDLWAQALGVSPSIQSNGLFCHRKHYSTPGGSQRTMYVFVSSVNYAGQYGTKGIITAYWTSGHHNC